MRRLKSFIRFLNESIAIHVTLAMSTMWCVYLFAIWSLLPLMIETTTQLVFYVSSAIIQLVALPLIMVGQSVLSRKSELRAEADHMAVMEILSDIRAMFAQEDRLESDERIEMIDLCKLDERLVRIEKMLARIPTNPNPNPRKRRQTLASS